MPTSSVDLVVQPPETVTVPISGSRSRFPVRRVYCVGRNYEEHAKEMGFTGREPPFFFLKPADAVVPAGADGVASIHYPPCTHNFHHEVELVVAIGQGGQNIPVDQALNHVWGYAVGLDMTRRDLQNDMKKQGRPWCIGKAFDESAPIGALSPCASVPHIHAANISLKVNGSARQSSTTAKLIWNVAETISHLSQAWTLAPGDLIYTGTPEGVAAVVSGDVLDAHIDGLTGLTVKVI